jgi:hypothetical protein
LVDVCAFQKGFLELTPSGRLVEWKDSSSWSWRLPETLGIVVAFSCDADGAVVVRSEGTTASWGSWYPEQKSPPDARPHANSSLPGPSVGRGGAEAPDQPITIWIGNQSSTGSTWK